MRYGILVLLIVGSLLVSAGAEVPLRELPSELADDSRAWVQARIAAVIPEDLLQKIAPFAPLTRRLLSDFTAFRFSWRREDVAVIFFDLSEEELACPDRTFPPGLLPFAHQAGHDRRVSHLLVTPNTYPLNFMLFSETEPSERTLATPYEVVQAIQVFVKAAGLNDDCLRPETKLFRNQGGWEIYLRCFHQGAYFFQNVLSVRFEVDGCLRSVDGEWPSEENYPRDMRVFVSESEAVAIASELLAKHLQRDDGQRPTVRPFKLAESGFKRVILIKNNATYSGAFEKYAPFEVKPIQSPKHCWRILVYPEDEYRRIVSVFIDTLTGDVVMAVEGCVTPEKLSDPRKRTFLRLGNVGPNTVIEKDSKWRNRGLQGNKM